jgi:hypothetical protein
VKKSSDRCAVTIATVSYLPRAFAGMESYLRHNPGSDAYILVADMSADLVKTGKWPLSGDVQVLGVDDLEGPAVLRMHGYFNALEFCCAAKSFLVEHVLLRLNYRMVIWLDPDTFSFSSYDAVWQALNKRSIALVPHSNCPMPDDGHLPSDRELAMAGFANAGIWGVTNAKGSREALQWLKERLIHYGFFSPSNGMYADQMWLSCLPWYFPDDVIVVRHPGIDIAYWNLHERKLSGTKTAYLSNGEPLIMFHFSGYRQEAPDVLTIHPSRPLSERNTEVVKELLQQYQQALSQWQARVPKWQPDRPCFQGPLSAGIRRYRKLWNRESPLRQGNQASALSGWVRSNLVRPIRNLLGGLTR